MAIMTFTSLISRCVRKRICKSEENVIKPSSWLVRHESQLPAQVNFSDGTNWKDRSHLEGLSRGEGEVGQGVLRRTPLPSQTGVPLDGFIREADFQLEAHVALWLLLLGGAGHDHLHAVGPGSREGDERGFIHNTYSVFYFTGHLTEY